MFLQQWKGFGRLALCCVVLLGAACDRSAPAGALSNDAASVAVAPADAPSPEQQLLVDLEGVWVAPSDPGTDDSATMYMVQREGDTLKMFVDEDEWDVVIDDIDAGAGTVALVHENTGRKEILTLRRVPAEEGDGHRLGITFGAGQYELLGFVRRISPADLRRIEAIRSVADAGDADGDSPEFGIDCEQPSGFREAEVCKDPALQAQHHSVSSRFDTLSARGMADIEATTAAAWKQLDACRTRQCLSTGYAEWVSYLDDNYPQLMVE